MHSIQPSPDVAHRSAWLSLPNDSLNREMQSTNEKFNFQLTRGHRQEPCMESLSDNIKSSCPHLNKTRLHERQDGVSSARCRPPLTAKQIPRPSIYFLSRMSRNLKPFLRHFAEAEACVRTEVAHTHTHMPHEHIASTDMPN